MGDYGYDQRQQQQQGYYPTPPHQPQHYGNQQQQHYPQYPPQGYYPPQPQQQVPPMYGSPNYNANNGDNYNQNASYTGGANTHTSHGQNAGSTAGIHPEKFNPRPKYNDVWAAILYAVHLAAFAYVAFLGINALRNPPEHLRQNTPSNSGGLDINWSEPSLIIALLVAAAVGFATSAVYYLMMERFAGIMIKVTFMISIIVNLVFALILVFVSPLAGIISLVFAILYALCWFWWRKRIPFATIMLQTVTSVTKKYKGTFAAALLGLVVDVAYTVFFLVTVAGIFNYTSDPPSECTRTTDRNGRTITSCPSSTKRAVLVIFSLFSYYWVSQVIKNLVHVTVSGVFAAYYFLEGSAQGVPSSPTLSSFKRASTTSFGSICFGSLIIALIKTVRAIIRMAADNSDNGCASFVAGCAVCLLDYIDSLVQYFNHYAYTQVAIYGKDFCTAAKDTWTIIKDRGIEALINDNLIGNVLTIGGLLVGAFTGLITYLYILAVRPAFAAEGFVVVIVVLLGVLVGFVMMNIASEVITSGTATTFVALAEDPEALARTKPELFEKIRVTYPEVVVGV